MYPAPYLHDDYAGELEDLIVHALQSELLILSSTCASYVDSHAGAGRYWLGFAKAARKRKLDMTLGNLYHIRPRTPGIQALIAVLRRISLKADQPAVYPGSPLLASTLLRPGCPITLIERNRSVAVRLANWSRRRRLVTVLCGDGYSLAPLVSRLDRQLIYVDPAYEHSGGDFQKIIDLASQLANTKSTFAVTIPLATGKDLDQASNLFLCLRTLGLRIDLTALFYRSRSPTLRGAGLVVLNANPAFFFRAQRVLQELKEKLSLRNARLVLRTSSGTALRNCAFNDVIG